MFCAQCGKELPEQAKFCNICGKEVVVLDENREHEAQDAAETSKAALQETDSTDAGIAPAEDGADISNVTEAEDASDSASETGDPRAIPGESGAVNKAIAGDKLASPKRKNTRVIIGAIAAAITVVAIVAGVFGYNAWKDDQERHAIRYGQIEVSSELLTSDFTPIALQVTGTDIDGNSVSQLIFADMSQVSNGTVIVAIPLEPGDYEVTMPPPVANLPVNPDGPPVVLLPPPDYRMPIVVDPTDPPGTYLPPQEDVVELTPIEDWTQLTDEQINLILKYAEEAGYDKDKLDQLRQALVEARDKAIAEAEERKRQEEEARRKAELKAKYHIETRKFAFDIPEYWYDKVEWDIQDNGSYVSATVYPLGNRKAILLSAWAADPNTPGPGGDTSIASLNVPKSASGNWHTGITWNNWPGVYAYMKEKGSLNQAESSYGITSADQWNTYINLATGGNFSTDNSKLSNNPMGSMVVSGAVDWANAAIAPSFVTY